MILLDHLSRRKTWPIACVSATKTNCYLEQTWLKKTNQVKERQNDKDKMENRAENFLISWLKTFICPDNLQAWVLNPIKVKTWVLSVPNSNSLHCSTDPHDVDDVLAADRPVVFVVSSAPRRDGGRAGAATTDCWEELDLYFTTKYVTCSLSTYSCAPRRWWGRRCRTRASRQGRQPCGAEAQVSARGSHHTRSSRGQGLGRRGVN